ncbi:MAG: glycosyltransferase [Actinomycetes bacterium]
MNSSAPRIAVLMTCHDRRAKTTRCLESLRRSAAAAGVLDRMRVFLVDDGSTDGTAEAAKEAWPGIAIIAADGSKFWAGGMALAESEATRAMSDMTHLLWLNDDVVLDEAAIEALLATSTANPEAIAVGAMRDLDGELSYSGVRFTSRWHPLRFERVEPGEAPIEVEAMNGNLVLVPARIASSIGGVDGGFSQQAGDFDYGIRARAAGAVLLLAPGTLGVCPRNEPTPEPAGLKARWRRLNDPVGLANRDQLRFIRRHGSWVRPMLLVVPYIQFAAAELARLPAIGRLIPRRALRAPRS